MRPELKESNKATFSSIQGWGQAAKDAFKNSNNVGEVFPVQATPTSGFQSKHSWDFNRQTS